jgi:L-fuculose-phosphate aldolase
VAVTPTGAKLGELEAEHIVVVGTDGRQLEGSLAPASELAEAVLAALEGRAAALMANHGAVTVGPAPDTAGEASLLLEWACGLDLRAAAIGEPLVLDEKAEQAVVDS